MKPYLYVLILTIIFLSFHHKIFGKILAPEEYGRILLQKTDTELQHEYEIWRKELATPAREFSTDIEPDITLTQKPSYKINMFNTVIQEIARRSLKASTTNDLARFVDLFFKNEPVAK